MWVSPTRGADVSVPAKDLTGLRFGKWTVEARGTISPTIGRLRWWCRCDCGIRREVSGQNLNSGISKSCGCDRNRSVLKHGLARTGQVHPLHHRWIGMIDRCHKPALKGFKNYGARGISVCDRWRFGENGKTGFECFLADMGNPPFAGASLDREDNDGNYEPSNVRWAGSKTQALNRRNAVWHEIDGVSKPLKTWADELGLRYDAAWWRLKHGISLTAPKRTRAKAAA